MTPPTTPPLDVDRGITSFSRRGVDTAVREFANAKRLYDAMLSAGFGTQPEEMEAIREHIRRDMWRVRALMSGEGEAEAEVQGGGVVDLLDRMIHRSLFSA